MLTDENAAYREQVVMLKNYCKTVTDQRDTAIIDYAVAEGMYLLLFVCRHTVC